MESLRRSWTTELGALDRSKKGPITSVSITQNVEYNMNEREKFLFDLRGYLRVENFLTPEEVQVLNEAVDANYDAYTEDSKMYGLGMDGKYNVQIADL